MSTLEFVSQSDLPATRPYWISAFLDDYSGYFADTDGPGVVVTYSFRDSGLNPDDSPFRPMTAAEKQAAVTALTSISAYANITFVEAADAQIEIGATSDATPGLPYGIVHRPGITWNGVDPETRQFLDDPAIATFYDQHYATPEGLAQNGYIWLHELLHAVGLDHSTSYFGNPSGIPDAEGIGTTLFGRWSQPYGAWQRAPMLFDIAALQYLYGPAASQRAGDDTYVVGLGAYDPVNPDTNQTLLWDGAGFDTLDLRHSALNAEVTLVAGIISRVGGATGGILDAGTFAINHGSVFEGLMTGAGNDRLTGNHVGNRLASGAGDDTLTGDLGNDSLTGGSGNDVLDGGTGTDRAIYTGSASIILNLGRTGPQGTGQGSDTLISIEQVVTSAGHDRIQGNAAGNVISTGLGNDVLNGGGGRDTLTGGGGADAFVFSTPPAASNADKITDFRSVDDIIHLDHADFGNLALGALAAASFRASAGGQASTAQHRILYDTAGGGLYFDADGTGAAGRVLIATLLPGTALALADFLVI